MRMNRWIHILVAPCVALSGGFLAVLFTVSCKPGEPDSSASNLAPTELARLGDDTPRGVPQAHMGIDFDALVDLSGPMIRVRAEVDPEVRRFLDTLCISLAIARAAECALGPVSTGKAAERFFEGLGFEIDYLPKFVSNSADGLSVLLPNSGTPFDLYVVQAGIHWGRELALRKECVSVALDYIAGRRSVPDGYTLLSIVEIEVMLLNFNYRGSFLD
jgi:hypothetical protein